MLANPQAEVDTGGDACGGPILSIHGDPVAGICWGRYIKRAQKYAKRPGPLGRI
jgi:hypothetical protein